ncbi:cytochrome P450 [Nocardiopsis nanhaiensis]
MAGTGAATTDQVREMIAHLVAHRRAHPDPEDRLVSALIAGAQDGDHPMPETELIDTVMLLVSAGYETTMGALTNIAHLLLTHPAHLEALRGGEVTWGQVINEGLRHSGPVNTLSWLFATEDIDYPGQVIEAGEAVLMCYLAANRDPHRHGPSAGDFIPGRARSAHLAFGHGAHHCLGRPLARLELEIALPALFERFTDLRLAQSPVEFEPSIVMNQPAQLLAYPQRPQAGPGR